MDKEAILDLKKLTGLSENEIERFDEAFSELEAKTKSISENYKEDEFDEYCIDSINLFYQDQYGFPKELYKGVDDDEKNNFIKEIVRQVKTALWQMCNEMKDNKSVTAVKNFTLSAIVHTLTPYLTTVDPTFISIFVFAYLEFARSFAFEDFCSMFEY
ncbi:hypothetical protein [Tenacibaculum agarivorans]|uniref:hypothetical protein n=1 Tax=Tenacibaculum agarivorans TaxID=1908389 RepID=UPI00094BB3C7|nr:hypothetical protein [Tenacibaculum agarivorans]